MLFAVTSGVVVGSVVLWSVKEAQLAPNSLRRAQWLARFAVPREPPWLFKISYARLTHCKPGFESGIREVPQAKRSASVF
jgi:hypothetical protein